MMSLLPKRRKAPKFGLREDPREFPGHRAWVRGHCCSVPGCDLGPIEFAHVRKGLPVGEAGGTGLKPHDKWGISLCKAHHNEQHQIGEATFAAKYGLDLVALARAFAKQSPHRPRWEDAA